MLTAVYFGIAAEVRPLVPSASACAPGTPRELAGAREEPPFLIHKGSCNFFDEFLSEIQSSDPFKTAV